jgi:hypothetical protein
MKLPLEATIAGGYRFLFSRCLSIVGTLWLPYLLLAALAVAGAYLVLPHGIIRGDFTGVDLSLLMSGPVHALRGLFGFASLVVAAMVTVNLMRHALGLKENTTFAYFSLGLPVWRMVGAYLLAIIVLIVLVIALVLAGVALGFVVYHHADKGPAIAAIVAVSLLLFFAFIYCAARLCFFLPAVVVAEERIGLGRAWKLGGGNFWRIFVVWLLVAIPIWFVVGIVLQATILPVILSELAKLPRHPEAEQVMTLARSVIHQLPVVIPVLFLCGIVFRAVMAGAIGTAYNAVTAPKEEKTSV